MKIIIVISNISNVKEKLDTSVVAPPSLTKHGGLFQELVAGLEGHLLQR